MELVLIYFFFNKITITSNFLAFYLFFLRIFPPESGSGASRENECGSMRIRIHSPGFSCIYQEALRPYELFHIKKNSKMFIFHVRIHFLLIGSYLRTLSTDLDKISMHPYPGEGGKKLIIVIFKSKFGQARCFFVP